MKHSKRLLAGFLSLLMILSLCTAWPSSARAAGGQEPSAAGAAGDVKLTIQFALPQTRRNVDARDLTVTVSSGAKRTVVPVAGGTPAPNELGIQAAVTARNTSGVELTTEQVIGYYDVLLSGLPAGGQEYELTVAGTGYVTYSTKIELDKYSKHVAISTGGSGFALGDVNGDGTVSQLDLEAMDRQLGRTEELDRYDFNGDGLVDVTDLAYVNQMIDAVSSGVEIKDTTAIEEMEAISVDTSDLTVTGDIDSLFSGGSVVQLSPAAPGGDLEIPITLREPVEMSEIVISSPEGDGAIQAGSVVVETEEGVQTYPFDISTPDGVHAIGRRAGESVVTIDLGKKVAVKKVTIKVTLVAGQNGAKPEFTTITQIEFLKDIVPDDWEDDKDQVKGLAAQPGNEKVDLTWTAVNNVTGYLVAYGTSENSLSQSLSVNTNSAEVSGLKNLTKYFFQVTAVNGDWRGKPSAIVSATPQPSGAPGAPSNIRVESADGALRVSWGNTKDASFYQVFYRTAGSADFKQSGGNLTGTSTVIAGLTNGTKYEVAVKAGNNAGVGPYSAIASGTPERETIEMPELPTDGRIPNSMVESIQLANPGNVDKSLCPNFETGHLIDNDAGTYWVARTWWDSSAITYTFKEPQDMNYMILVPYLERSHRGAIKNYSIVAKDAEGNELSNGSYRAQRISDTNYLVLTFPAVKGVKSLTVSLAEWEGNGRRVSVSEAAFYKSDSLPEDIAALFANDSFTQLKDGVTAEQIAALESRLDEKSSFYLDPALLRDELSLAKGLLAQEDALGTVRTGFQSRSGSLDKEYGQTASDFQPLGISVAVPEAVQAGTTPGTTVAVYAELPDDKPVYLIPTQFFGESGVWRGGEVQLSSGRNYITIPQIGSLTDERGGALYLSYAGEHPEDIKLQVRDGVNIISTPLLELSGWYDMTEAGRKTAITSYVEDLVQYTGGLDTQNLTTNVRNATEISTPSVLLSLPADQVLAGLKGTGNDTDAMVEVMYQNILAWEDVLFAANKVQGIIPSNAYLADYRYPMTTRQNIRYMRMFAGAFMYAAGNHIGIGYGSASGLVQGAPVSQTGEGAANRLFGWGIAHEIGHNMDKLGRAEITNNIYSLAVQAWDGGSMELSTRLTFSNIWSKIFDKVSAGRPGAANNVFVQLGMYWQLHLAYDGGDEPLAFYNQFFKLLKAGEFSSYSADERIALIASKVADRNLTEFFTRWGMTLSEEVRTQLSGYANEDRALWYLDDGSRIYRLNDGGAFGGEVSAQAEAADNAVTITITGGDSESLQGYEIRRNGKSIGFTTEETYTDDLGAANNLSYTYSVVPVDKLGNVGEEAQAGQVRVAYDKTISEDLYTVDRSPEAVTFTMKDGAVAVTGIKVTGENLSGTYSVRLKATADGEWVSVKSGTLSGASVVDYFNKPGAEPEDTRIWTYDAAVVEVTGIPDGASVQLLDYPGDRIDFYEGATVGLLAEAYQYTGAEGQTETIPAGTLVILGTYRGDPVFNTVEIQARYTTAVEAAEDEPVVERPMNGYALLFAELPEDGKVSDTSDGFFLFVPDMEAEKELNEESKVTDGYPYEIRAVFYRTDNPDGSGNSDGSASRRVTSETLWVSFPEEDTLPQVTLDGEMK